MTGPQLGHRRLHPLPATSRQQRSPGPHLPGSPRLPARHDPWPRRRRPVAAVQVPPHADLTDHAERLVPTGHRVGPGPLPGVQVDQRPLEPLVDVREGHHQPPRAFYSSGGRGGLGTSGLGCGGLNGGPGFLVSGSSGLVGLTIGLGFEVRGLEGADGRGLNRGPFACTPGRSNWMVCLRRQGLFINVSPQCPSRICLKERILHGVR